MKSYRIFQVIPGAGTVLSNNVSSIWKNILHYPLIDLGHDVYLLDYYYDTFFINATDDVWLSKHEPDFSNFFWKMFYAEHKINKFDFCFLYLCDGFINFEIIEKIKRLNVPVFNFSCNNIHQFFLVKNICKVVTCSLYSEKHAKAKFDAEGVHSIHFQLSANPNIYINTLSKKTIDVSFVGTRYANRGYFLSEIINQHINTEIYGPRWQKQDNSISNLSFSDLYNRIFSMLQKNGFNYSIKFLTGRLADLYKKKTESKMLFDSIKGQIDDETMLKVFNSSKINLGLSTVNSENTDFGTNLNHIKLRDFEIPMCGGFYLIEYLEEIEEYYILGKEIECFTDKDEMIDKIKFYLLHDNSRESIANSGYQRSIKEHTSQLRFQKLFSNTYFSKLIN